MKKPFYITTAIAYTSAKPHIGNVYEIVLADSIARYHRLLKEDVYFQTGTDEHGQKIELAAIERGISTKEYVDGVVTEIKRLFDQINISYDRFIRTTDEEHMKTVQQIFKKLYEQGDIYKGNYEGWYCTPCESFWTETQLVDGKCPDCGGEVHKEKEEVYFLKLSKYQDRLVKYIEENPTFIQPESRKNEMINNFIKPGIQDLSVSRTSFKWGIPVDFDDKHVVYVWIDALSNYISSLGFSIDGNHGELFNKYWPADLHLIGKDILRFHTIYWPIMLMALDIELPKKVFGHPWILMGGDKMSKSKGNTIYSDELIKHLGVDAVRYYVLHETPYANDGNITWSLIVERTNVDLANILGNLVNRTLAMANKYFGGVIHNRKVNEDIDNELKALVEETHVIVDKKMQELKVQEAMTAIFNILRRSNKYIDETLPWVLAKDESTKDRLETVLYNLLESIRIAAVLLEPYLPDTSKSILNQLQTNVTDYDTVKVFGQLEDGIKVTDKPTILFERIDEEKLFEELESEIVKEEVVEDETITFDEFKKIKLVVGTVVESRKHENADKLLVSKIDIGTKVVQIVSGIADSISPEQFVGKKVIVVKNLLPTKIRKEISEGMILAGEDNSGLEVISIDHLENGTEIN